mmetsp:Transcript_32679/g.75230  ORF Transcript_32679/g.75230 Transcript_32679/m.75230 type:complete len:290 (-) Transcript_32679:531-1400(-)
MYQYYRLIDEEVGKRTSFLGSYNLTEEGYPSISQMIESTFKENKNQTIAEDAILWYDSELDDRTFINDLYILLNIEGTYEKLKKDKEDPMTDGSQYPYTIAMHPNAPVSRPFNLPDKFHNNLGGIQKEIAGLAALKEKTRRKFLDVAEPGDFTDKELKYLHDIWDRSFCERSRALRHRLVLNGMYLGEYNPSYVIEKMQRGEVNLKTFEGIEKKSKKEIPTRRRKLEKRKYQRENRFNRRKRTIIHESDKRIAKEKMEVLKNKMALKMQKDEEEKIDKNNKQTKSNNSK